MGGAHYKSVKVGVSTYCKRVPMSCSQRLDALEANNRNKSDFPKNIATNINFGNMRSPFSAAVNPTMPSIPFCSGLR